MPNQTSPKIDLLQRSRKIVEEITRQRSTEYRLVIRALLMLAMADGALIIVSAIGAADFHGYYGLPRIIRVDPPHP